MTRLFRTAEPLVFTGLCIGLAVVGAIAVPIVVIGAIHQRWVELRDAQLQVLEDAGATMYDGDELTRWS